MLRVTPAGLWCEAGGFHIDPWRRVERAVITHGHSDHARPGSEAYLAAAPGVPILRHRLGSSASIHGLAYGERMTLGDVTVSLHPAGHVLGSAQVRVEHRGEAWVVSGDYKLEQDPTCDAFEPVRCRVFISEVTFALPIYRWPGPKRVAAEIATWWAACQAQGRTAVLYGYSLGKAQRLQAMLPAGAGPVLVHAAVAEMNEAYRAAGVSLAAAATASVSAVRRAGGRALIVAPPTALGARWAEQWGEASHACASGWMLVRGGRRREGLDRGFVLSDHADWPGLLQAIRATGCERVGLTHGQTGPLERYLREAGLDAFTLATAWRTEEDRTQHDSGDATGGVDTAEGGIDGAGG